MMVCACYWSVHSGLSIPNVNYVQMPSPSWQSDFWITTLATWTLLSHTQVLTLWTSRSWARCSKYFSIDLRGWTQRMCKRHAVWLLLLSRFIIDQNREPGHRPSLKLCCSGTLASYFPSLYPWPILDDEQITTLKLLSGLSIPIVTMFI